MKINLRKSYFLSLVMLKYRLLDNDTHSSVNSDNSSQYKISAIVRRQYATIHNKFENKKKLSIKNFLFEIYKTRKMDIG